MTSGWDGTARTSSVASSARWDAPGRSQVTVGGLLHIVVAHNGQICPPLNFDASLHAEGRPYRGVGTRANKSEFVPS